MLDKCVSMEISQDQALAALKKGPVNKLKVQTQPENVEGPYSVAEQ